MRRSLAGDRPTIEVSREYANRILDDMGFVATDPVYLERLIRIFKHEMGKLCDNTMRKIIECERLKERLKREKDESRRLEIIVEAIFGR